MEKMQELIGLEKSQILKTMTKNGLLEAVG
jgi:hypothetical protein